MIPFGIALGSPFCFSNTGVLTMPKRFVFRARVDESHQRKIESLQAATGYSQSQLLRSLVEQAQASATSNVPMKRNSDVTTRQGSHVAAAA